MAVTPRINERRKGRREKKSKNTHEWEFDQESVLHDWCHGKELYDRAPNRGLLKTAHCDLLGCSTYEDDRGSNTDSPDPE